MHSADNKCWGAEVVVVAPFTNSCPPSATESERKNKFRRLSYFSHFSFAYVSCPGFKSKFVSPLVQEVSCFKYPHAVFRMELTVLHSGCHLVHDEIVSQVPEIRQFKVGMANVFCEYPYPFSRCLFYVQLTRLNSATYISQPYAKRECGSHSAG